MFGRLPWFALERRSRALRFLVFFDMAGQANGAAGRSGRCDRLAGGGPGYGPPPWRSTGHATTGSVRCGRPSKATSSTRDDLIFDDGASVAVTYEGELVVDLWGGTVDTDAAQGVPWERDTIINVWSTTKTMTALACLVLADRGELDLDGPVARYWPEFKAGGKDDVARAPLLSHTAGLSGWEEPITRGPLRLGTGDVAAGGPGAVVGAGHGVRLPRHDPGLPGGRARPPHHRPDDRARSSPSEIAGPLGADFHIGTGARARRPRRATSSRRRR